MTEWKKCKIADFGRVVTGKTPSTKEKSYWGGDVPFITPKDLQAQKHILLTERNISEQGKQAVKNSILPAGSICVSCIGNIGYTGVTVAESVTNQQINSIIPFCREEMDFIYYTIRNLWGFFKHYEGQSTALSILNKTQFEKIEVTIPTNQEGRFKIGAVLRSIDEKIEENIAINHNLQQQVLAMYQKMFVDSPNDNRKTCRADEYFDISIGKTPPRKEAEWFKTVQVDNIVWVSIADMGNCGLFIADSSEYLSPAAVKKFNVAIVPDNTVLLSFKLTVGRIAITDGWMTTNEAIAHFKTQNKFINEYLYCYLKSYNFQTLGSTSSIATAVNSKIIKAMPFVVPTDDELAVFHNFAAPIFEKIKACQHENVQLTRLRDSLLPKLMSGEIDVSEVKI